MDKQYQEQPAEAADDLLAGAKRLLAENRFAQARQSVDEHLARRPRDHTALFLRARIIEREGDLPGALVAMQAAVDARRGKNPRHVAHLVRLMMANGQLAEAEATLEAALARHGDVSWLLAQGLALATAKRDAARAMQYGSRYVAVVPTDPGAKPNILIALARVKRDYQADDEALGILDAGLRRWPGSVPLLRAKVQILSNTGRKAEARAVLRDELLAQPDLEPEVRERCVDRLAFLEGKAYVGADSRMVHLPGEPVRDELWLRLNDGATEGVVVRRSPGAHKMLVVFTGLAREAGGVPLSLLDALLRELPVHVVYLRDAQRMLYLKGVPELGKDFQETAAGLRALQQELGATEVYCFGNSAGGYAAIRFGIALQADTVLGLGAATTTDRKTVRSFDTRATSMGLRLLAEVPGEMGNLRDDLQRTARPPRVLLHFGADMPTDVAHANNLAGLPDVHLFPLPGIDRHDLAGQLLSEGRLVDVIREAVDEPVRPAASAS